MEYGMVDYYSRYVQLYVAIAYSILAYDLSKSSQTGLLLKVTRSTT